MEPGLGMSEIRICYSLSSMITLWIVNVGTGDLYLTCGHFLQIFIVRQGFCTYVFAYGQIPKVDHYGYSIIEELSRKDSLHLKCLYLNLGLLCFLKSFYCLHFYPIIQNLGNWQRLNFLHHMGQKKKVENSFLFYLLNFIIIRTLELLIWKKS